MKKKTIGIIICMLFIGLSVFPSISGKINNNLYNYNLFVLSNDSLMIFHNNFNNKPTGSNESLKVQIHRFGPFIFTPLFWQFVGSIEGGRKPYKYIWEFGDGNPSRNKTSFFGPAWCTHRFPQNGEYYVNLTAWDKNGLTDYEEWPITVPMVHTDS